MRLLRTAQEISVELIRLVEDCASCQVAVAWASVRFDAFDHLLKYGHKIERMVVGTHFYQTHPDFIATFLSNPHVRFVVNPDGVYHPKVYLFDKGIGEWECLVGSANFTKGGVSTNDEMAVLMTNKDDGAQDALIAVKAGIDGYWKKARPLTADQLRAYRKSWKQRRPILQTASTMEKEIVDRMIIAYGHGDTRPGLGFASVNEFRDWIKTHIFSKYQARYHYTQKKNAHVVILTRDGEAHGHFEIAGKEKANQQDYDDYPDLQCVYKVRSSALYGTPVHLSSLGIRVGSFGKKITETQFDQIKKAAGDMQEYDH